MAQKRGPMIKTSKNGMKGESKRRKREGGRMLKKGRRDALHGENGKEGGSHTVEKEQARGSRYPRREGESDTATK